MTKTALFAGILLLGCSVTRTRSEGPEVDIGALAHPQMPEGCACELYRDEGQTILVLISEMDGGDAWFNLDDRDVKLALYATTHKGTNWEAGTKFERTYLYKQASVHVTFQVGDFRGENFIVGGRKMEGWPMQARIATSSGSVKASGACGC